MGLEKLFGLTGKIAVVTGGAGLYGYAISEALCEAGATVIVASRSDGAFMEKCAGLVGRYPIFHRRLDMTDPGSVGALIAGIREEYGRLDILVNNAVTTPFGKSLHDTEPADWTSCFENNAVSLLTLCQRAADVMREQKSGVILNISSIWGTVSPDYGAYAEAGQSPNPIAYSFLKGGVNMLTRALASQLAPYGIRVNAVSPGGIADDTDTEIYREIYRKKTPLGRWAEPEDIKGAIVYLCSDAASYVTGENLVIDGGYTIR